MGSVNVIAGDVVKGRWDFAGTWNPQTVSFDNLRLVHGLHVFYFKNDIRSVDLIKEENKKEFLGSATAGAIGGLLLGPVGLVAGALAGGNKNEVTFIGYLNDGKKFMATTDRKTFTNLQTALF